jgi:hypothetical protein
MDIKSSSSKKKKEKDDIVVSPETLKKIKEILAKEKQKK